MESHHQQTNMCKISEVTVKDLCKINELEMKLNLSISSPNISCVPLTDLNFILITKFYFFSFFSN